MFENYSQTYLASITTFAPLIVLILGKFGVPIAETELVTILSAIVGAIGFVWQLVNRFKKGGITPLGKKLD